MSNLYVGVDNLADTATISAVSDEDPNYPATNMQNPELAVPFRTLDPHTSGIFTVTLAAPLTSSLFALALIGVNFDHNYLVQADLNDAGTTSVSDDESNYGWWLTKIDGRSRNIALLLYSGASITWSAAAFSITNVGNPDGYLEIPRLAVVNLLTPTGPGFGYDWSCTFEDPSERSESAGGNMVHRRKAKRRILDMGLKSLAEADAWDLYFEQVDALRGKTGDCLVIPLPPATFPSMATRLHQRMLWGPQNEVGALSNPRFKRYAKQISFRERT